MLLHENWFLFQVRKLYAGSPYIIVGRCTYMMWLVSLKLLTDPCGNLGLEASDLSKSHVLAVAEVTKCCRGVPSSLHYLSLI